MTDAERQVAFATMTAIDRISGSRARKGAAAAIMSALAQVPHYRSASGDFVAVSDLETIARTLNELP